MAGVWKVLVVLVGLAVVACAIPRRRLRYEEVVAQALQFYNEGQQGRPLFRLLEATPPPSLNSKSRIPLNFRIKETVCISTPDRQPGNCAFREGGEERICRGAFVRRRRVHALTLHCDRDQRFLESLVQQGPQPEAAALKAQSTKLPPVVQDLYENAKYNIISNILRNF